MAQLKLLKGADFIEDRCKPIIIVNDEQSYSLGDAILGDEYNILFYEKGKTEEYDFDKSIEESKVICFLTNDEQSQKDFDNIERRCSLQIGSVHHIQHFKNRVESYSLSSFIKQEQNNIDEIIDFINNNEARVKNKKNDSIKLLSKDRNFACLGYNGDFYYFYKKGNQTIVKVKSVNVDVKFIKTLETGDYWAKKYSNNSKDMFGKIAQDLREECESLGTYSETERDRSVGFWRDGTDFVYHDGEQIYSSKTKDRKDLFTYSMESDDKMVYTSSPKLNLKLGATLSANEKETIKEFIESFKWRTDGYAKIALGWAFVSPLGGLLEWRPNIWIKGNSGSGKTTVSNALKSLCMVDQRFKNDGGTTEAGLRNKLNNTAFGAFLDEFESENKIGKQKKQDIALLVRLASDGGSVTHGVSNFGGAATYTIKNCFCMVSIAVGLEQKADLNRFSILELDGEKETVSLAKFKELERNFYCAVDPRNLADEYRFNKDYCVFSPLRNKFITKSFDNIRKILNRTNIIRNILVDMTNDHRFSDKLAPMIAGYTVFDDLDLKRNEYKEYIENNFGTILEEQKQQEKVSLLDFQKALLASEVRFSKTKERFATEGDIAELISVYSKNEYEFHKSRKEYEEEDKGSSTTKKPAYLKELSEILKRKGIKIYKNSILFNLENKFLAKDLFIDQETLENAVKSFVNAVYLDYCESIDTYNKGVKDKKDLRKKMRKCDFCVTRRRAFGGVKVKTACLPLNYFIDLSEGDEF